MAPPSRPVLGNIREAFARVRSLDGVVVTTGVQAVDGASSDASGLNLATIAARQHFGFDGESEGPIGPKRTIHRFYGNPARPWLTRALEVNRQKWSAFAGRVVRAQARAEGPGLTVDGERALRQLGVRMAADAKLSITDGDWTPNSKRTIALKGSSRPLIDTGRLLQSQRAAVIVPGQAPEVIG